MMERAAGSLRSSQNGPKKQVFILFIYFFSVPYTGKILSVSLPRLFCCCCFVFIIFGNGDTVFV